MTLLSNSLAFMGRNGTWVLFSGIFLGLFLPQLATLLRPLIAYAVMLLLLFGLLRVDVRDLRRHLHKPLMPLLLTFWCMIVSPLLYWGLSLLLDLPQGLEQATVLMAACPSQSRRWRFSCLTSNWISPCRTSCCGWPQ